MARFSGSCGLSLPALSMLQNGKRIDEVVERKRRKDGAAGQHDDPDRFNHARPRWYVRRRLPSARPGARQAVSRDQAFHPLQHKDRFCGVARLNDPEVFLLQHFGHGGPDKGLILDNQNGRHQWRIAHRERSRDARHQRMLRDALA